MRVIMSNAKFLIIIVAFTMFVTLMASPGYSEELAALTKSWQDYQKNLPPLLPLFALTADVDTKQLLANQINDLRQLNSEPFLTVEGPDFSAAIAQRIKQAEENIQTLKERQHAFKTAAANFQTANFKESFEQITEVTPAQKELISRNLKLYSDIFTLYAKIDQPDGEIELINKRITNLKNKQAKLQTAREEPQKKYLEIWAALQAEIDETKVNKIIDDVAIIDNTPQIDEFVQILDGWYQNPQNPLPESHLDLLIDQFSEIFDLDPTPVKANAVDKVYLISEILDSDTTERIKKAEEQREKILKVYQDYRSFFESDKMFLLLDKHLAADDLIASYVIDGKVVARGWQPQGTWDYPILYKINGVRKQLFTLDKKDSSLEVINVEKAVIKYVKDLKFLSALDNKSLITTLNKLNTSVKMADNVNKNVNRAVSLLSGDEQEEKNDLEEKSAAIAKLVETALARFEKVHTDILNNVYIKTDITDFREKINLEIKEIEAYGKEIFLIYPDVLSQKAKAAQEKLREAAEPLFKKFNSIKSRRFEAGYNKELAEQIKVIQQRFAAYLKLTDINQVTKEFRALQRVLRQTKKGNVKHTESGESLTLALDEKNKKAIQQLDEQWAKEIAFYYYKLTTKPKLSALKVNDVNVKKPSITLKVGETSVTVSGKAAVSYAALKNGLSLSKVEHSVDGGKTYQAAKGTETWQFNLALKPGETQNLVIRAIDNAGTPSDVKKVSLTTPVPPKKEEAEKKAEEKEKTAENEATEAEK